MNIDISLLKKICETPGISGHEAAIRKVITEEIKGFADDIYVDNIGNLIVKKNGNTRPSKKVLVAAHMDEIGFMVDHIDDNGFIRFHTIGGFDPKTISSQRVVVHGKRDIIGVTGSKAIHVMTEAEKNKPLRCEDFFIDVGMEKKKVEELIPLGAPITRYRQLAEMGDCITCKSLDNRISVYILIEVLKQIKTVPYDIYLVFTVQEEVGLRGATVAAGDINPDFGIALDTGLANDTPADSGPGRKAKLHKGTGIKKLDRSVICDVRMVEFMKQTAEKYNIPYQMDMKLAGGTDTGALQLHGRCVAGAISTLTRYLHQTTETLSKKDVIASINLLKAVLEDINTFDWKIYTASI